jgi:hypothetical protein
LINKKYYLGIIGIIIAALIISVIVVSTHIITPENKTFTKSGITFQYPGTWSSNKTFPFVKDPSNKTEILGTIGNDKIAMAITANNITKNPPLYDFDTMVVMNSRLSEPEFKILSLKQTLINNSKAYKEISINTDPITNKTYKNIRLIMSTKTMWYTILFKTSESDFQKCYPIFEDIESSIILQ